MKILILDDCLPILNSLRMLLEMYQYEVEVAQDVSCLYDHSKLPDVLLIDYHMQGIDTPSLLAQLKNHAHFKNIPIILMSGDTDVKQISAQFPINNFITKPIDIKLLLDKLRIISQEHLIANCASPV